MFICQGIISCFLSVAMISCCCLGCGNSRYSSGDLISYRSAIRSGRTAIKASLEMETAFPKTEHMIIMYGGTGSARHEWQTVAYFGGRYELTMTVDVLLSSDGKTVAKVLDEPKFLLNVCDRITPGGVALYSGTRNQTFGIGEWTKFRISAYDPKTIDSEYDGSELPNFDTFVDGVQQSRKIWR